ncbi:MAG: glycine betaine/L-proline ABC transporter permease ProW [Sulfurospirillaceae bacterium]|nr:glycine betaine/L-proline ABC transporter permease ProW [Sulfurospirillaceae bacterium]NLM99274.1 glycine betaine/L-proline ABC transporter permease ProW [Campylobacteraceae bacterium]
MGIDSNPWTNETKVTQDSPWGDSSSIESTPDWLMGEESVKPAFDILNPFQESYIPIESWVESALSWVVDNFRDFFQSIKAPIDITLSSIENGLHFANPWVIVLLFFLIAWQISGLRLAIGTFISLLFIGFSGAWEATMITLSLVITSVVFCILLGLPLGIWISKSNRASMVVKPILDAMQTTPAFVYLIPIVMLFGIGNVPGVVVTIIFALPPLIRLTDLGIRQVPEDLIEASKSFGATSTQMLFRVQIPVAMPSIMAGINQTLMLSLSMVVIASMIAVGGLGQMVLRGIGRLDMGLAALGGISIVLLAIVLDRMTQSLGTKDKTIRGWYKKGPVGLMYKLFKKEAK